MLIRVIDLETSGFPGGNPPNMPCEAAYTDIVSVSPNNWLITKQDTTLLNPGKRIEQGAFDTHGISNEDVINAPDAKFVSNFFHWNVSIDYIVAHNWKFERNWVEERQAKPICTLIASKHVFKGLRSYKNKSVFDALECEKEADMSLCEPLHRALPDTYVTAHIMLKLLEKHSPEELALITAGKPLGKKIPFGKFKGLNVDDKDVTMTWLEWTVQESWVREDFKVILRAEIERRKNGG